MGPRIVISFTFMMLTMLFLGCTGQIVIDPDDSTRYRATAVSGNDGNARLNYADNTETVNIRNSASDAPLRGIQTLGLRSGADRLYVLADPAQAFHPAMTSGVPESYGTQRLYLTPVDQRTGSNTTSYHTVHGGLLARMAGDYAAAPLRTTVAGLRDTLSSRAWGKAAGLVTCVTQPISSYTGMISSTQVAQRSANLATAFQAIGWANIYYNYGYTQTQQLNVWVIDPARLRIQPNSSGALYDTLLVIVAPVGDAYGVPIAGSLRVELTWDAPVDLDLHLVRNYADLYDPYDDCYWLYLEQNWGDPYRTTDNPRLLYDNSSGYGPETIVMESMTPGDIYTVAIDYWGDSSGRPTSQRVNATVRVWAQNRATPITFQVYGFNYGAPYTGDYRIVCDIDGRTGQVTVANRTLSRSATRSQDKVKKDGNTMPNDAGQ